MNNLFEDIPGGLPEELVEILLSAGSLRVERIVSRGHATTDGTWYDQSQHEWVLLVQGAARLRFEAGDVVLEMKAGDFVNIPAHQRHRVEWTSPEATTIWLAVHYG